MSKQNFHLLLNRYRRGQCSEREKRLVEEWFSMLDEEFPEEGAEEAEEIEKRLWRAIQLKKAEPVSIWKRFPVRYAAAVLLTAALALGWALNRESETNVVQKLSAYAPDATLLKLYNDSDTVRIVSLADGSEVTLMPKSELNYPSVFGTNRRDVALTGKAFFRISKNPKSPFLVHTGSIVTRVLGTSFWVDVLDSEKTVEVSVVTGKVAVVRSEDAITDSGKPEDNPVILTANQKVRFSSSENQFKTGLVDQPQPVVAEDLPTHEPVSLEFEDTPITEVIGKLRETYGIEIILENEALKECMFHGDISQQSLFNKLDILCTSIGATYEIRGTRVLVSGKGCG